MSESQPPAVVEGATTGDIDDEIPQKAKSAEDRKAAAALSSLDAHREDDSTSTKTTHGTVAKKGDEKKVVKKTVKVEAADVNLLVEQLELTKIKARIY
ncbi:hypothetical protein DID88_005008 [Monilinia fructigena]|uniref:Nascent polypeptide-associated complex subunit alpha-like UBA domain-containing protein n=1 Tax=Monilinia fructigena TaxID=38457 RepID=A0A395IQ85_9HELO|nr:hypothetical protein DID88_005008 [Monilinia fructigena]